MHAGGPSPSLQQFEGTKVLCLGCAVVLGCNGTRVRSESQKTSTVTNKLERCQASVWDNLARDQSLAQNEDVVKCCIVTNRWNVGGTHGEMGEFYFLLLHNEPHEKHWHYDSDGNKTHAMLKRITHSTKVSEGRKLPTRKLHHRVVKKHWKHLPTGTRPDEKCVLLAAQGGSPKFWTI